MARALPLALALSLVTGCVVDVEPIEGAGVPIVNGTVDPGHPEVVAVYNRAGGLCTGTIIAPRVVLTAKHCVENGGTGTPAAASNFQVWVGSSTSRVSEQHFVSEVRAAPGSWNIGGTSGPDGSDVAVLILSRAAGAAPRGVSFANPTTLSGQTITAVGFGTTPGGSTGTKMTTTARVYAVRPSSRGDLIYVDPAVCPGDSGGPVIGPDGNVYGVASFIFDRAGTYPPPCGTSDGAYNSIARFQSLIETAIEDSGTCVPREEVCDGQDNDCDGEVDEGCTAFGERCSTDEECSGGLCATTADGRRCSLPCDPLRPTLGCPADFYCTRTSGCDGACVAGSAGTGENDADCSADTDCRSTFCLDPGDGRKRCLDPCEGGTGMCLAGEVCAAAIGACGGCVPRALVAGARGLGEPCDVDTECGSGMCFADDGVSYCSRACTAAADCGERFHCRDGVCARGPLEGIGGGCVANSDCGTSLCAMRADGESFCTAICSAPDDCPAGFACEDVGSGVICVPDLGLLGEECAVNAECTTGLCALNTPVGDVCTRLCGPDRTCSPGFECVRIGGGNNICLPAGGDPAGGGGGGCAIDPTRGGAGAPAGLFSLGLLLFFRRLRRLPR